MLEKKYALIKIREKTSFTFSRIDNAQAVALALCSAGYFVRISATSEGYSVWVYQHYNTKH